MMKNFSFILILIITSSLVNAQVYDYKYGSRQSHAGIQLDVNQNMGLSMIDNDGTKSAFAPFMRGGIYLKRQISKSLYFKASILVGNGNFSYKYTQTFQPTSDTTYPIGVMGKRNINLPVVEPAIAFGYLFSFKNKHQIDLRLGASMPLYLAKYSNSYEAIYTSVSLRNNERVRFGTTDQFEINNGKQSEIYNANLYLGYKRIHYNDLNDRLGIGLIVSWSAISDNAGVARFQGHNVTYDYEMWNSAHKLGYFSFGVRVEYDIF